MNKILKFIKKTKGMKDVHVHIDKTSALNTIRIFPSVFLSGKASVSKKRPNHYWPTPLSLLYFFELS